MSLVTGTGVGQDWYNMRKMTDEYKGSLWAQLYTACQSSNLSTLPTIQKEMLGYIKGPNGEKYVIGFLQPGGNANYTLFVNSNDLANGFAMNNSNRGTISSNDEIVIENSLPAITKLPYSSTNIPDSVINGPYLPPIRDPEAIVANETNVSTDISTSNTTTTNSITSNESTILTEGTGGPSFETIVKVPTTTTIIPTTGPSDALRRYIEELDAKAAQQKAIVDAEKAEAYETAVAAEAERARTGKGTSIIA